MRIGIISDIHGNLPALKVILDKLDSEKCDFIYCLGDSISIGPYSRECIELLLSIHNVKFVMGNHEEYFIKGTSSLRSQGMSEGEKKHQAWISNSLNEEIKQKISRFPYIIQENIEGVNVAFMHYALSEDGPNRIFKHIEPIVTIEKLSRLFEDIDADVIFFGHDHKAFDIKGEKHYVDVGSSGCTRDDITQCTIVDFQGGNYNVVTHKIKYDKDKVLSEMEKRNVPEGEIIAKIFF